MLDWSALDVGKLDLNTFPREGLIQLRRLLTWKKYPYRFLTEACYTKDEVAVNRPDLEVTRLIPTKDYIKELVDAWQFETLLCVVKSRRMVVSWVVCALELWLCTFTLGAAVYVISLDQTSSDKFLARHLFMYERLPAWMPRPQLKVWRGKEGDPTKIEFLETGSRIEALSQEPDKIRGEGATLVRCEEMAFWPWPDRSWKAILPTIQGGGRIVIVSSAQDGSFFKGLVYDNLSKAVSQPAKLPLV